MFYVAFSLISVRLIIIFLEISSRIKALLLKIFVNVYYKN